MMVVHTHLATERPQMHTDSSAQNLSEQTGATQSLGETFPEYTPPGGVATRLIVPDVARGLMLWGIAVANVATAWILLGGGPSTTTGPVVNDSVWDKVTIMFTTSFMHSRGFPMFSTLLGFGLGILVNSLYRRGYPLSAARGVLVRRYAMLSLLGAIHMVFLFWGDVMLAYGALGMFFVALIRLKTKTLLWIAGSLFSFTCLVALVTSLLLSSVAGLDTLNGQQGQLSDYFQADSYLNVVLGGLLVLVMSLLGVPVQGFMLLPFLLVGFVLAREGILAHVQRHRRTLIWVAFVGAVAAFGTGVPAGLEAIGVLPTSIFAVATMTVGTLAGPGFIALLALMLDRVQGRVNAGAPVPVFLYPLIALGKRSMTGYGLQSVIFMVVFAPFGLGLFADAGAGLLFLVGTAGWVMTLLVAVALDLCGQQGPLERVHRRLSYGRAGLQAWWMPSPAGYSAGPEGHSAPV